MDDTSVIDRVPKVKSRKSKQKKCTTKQKKKCEELKPKIDETPKQFEIRKKKVCKCPKKEKKASMEMQQPSISVSSSGPTLVQQAPKGDTVNTLHRSVPKINLKYGDSKIFEVPRLFSGVKSPEFPEFKIPEKPFATDPISGQPVETGVQHDFTNTLYNHYGQVGIGQSSPSYFDHNSKMNTSVYHDIWHTSRNGYVPPTSAEVSSVLVRPSGPSLKDPRTKEQKAKITSPLPIDISFGPTVRPDTKPVGGGAPEIGGVRGLFGLGGGLGSIL